MPNNIAYQHSLDWPVVTLREITTKIGSGATPRGGAENYMLYRHRFALVRSQNVFDRRFDPDGLAFISDEQAASLRGASLQPNDILLNITGDGITFGRACIVPPLVLPACVNQHVSIVRVDPSRADPGYVLAFLTHPDVKPYIESFNAGGSRRAITKGHIESFRIPLPSLAEQRTIAHILGTLDDKIDLNRRMSETLEAMARALFKSWFEDFDPVRAKAEGRDTGLPKEIADLFPDRFVDSELGEIPEGWEVGGLNALVQQVRDIEHPSSHPDQLYRHFSIPAFDSGKWPVTERGAGIKSQKSRVPAEAILLSKLNPETDRVWLVDVQSGEKAVCSTEFLVLTPRVPSSRVYAYCAMRSTRFRSGLERLVTGTSKSHQRAQPQAIVGLSMVQPPPALIRAFERITGTMVARALACQRESRVLGEARDALLPRLVSGKLQPKNGLEGVRESVIHCSQ